MYIRKTKVKSGPQGEAYYTYRIVESTRSDAGVKQRTIVNLGKHFEVPAAHWSLLVNRIEQIVQSRDTQGQPSLFDLREEMEATLEKVAQRYAALIIHKFSQPLSTPGKIDEHASKKATENQYAHVDLSAIEVTEPRSIGAEAIAYHALAQLHLDKKLLALGFNRPHLAAAIGNIIGRMTAPGSELSTHTWLQTRSGLGEMIDHDYKTTSLWRLYEVADDLLKHKDAIEAHLYQRENDLFQLGRTLVLYDLTNTYFEGQARSNPLACHGRSKEKRSDCPLVTLGLVLDGHGFPMNSQVFPGNASEPATLSDMLNGLENASGGKCSHNRPIVVLDAGIATQANIEWLKERGYHYLVVSRERKITPPSGDTVIVREDPHNRVSVTREACAETGEIRLYCHSELKEKKEQSIRNQFTERFEIALENLRAGLNKKGTVKKFEKIVERVGRLKEKFARVGQDYDITVFADDDKQHALDIQWKKLPQATVRDASAGTYCLRTDLTDWEEEKLWKTYVMLTDIEAAFRSMKSELGMRPIHHQKENRVTAHLFITLLAYHLVNTIRFQLKEKNIDLSWESIRNIMSGQQRVTVSLKTQQGDVIFQRISTKAEADQQRIYEALGMDSNPVGRRQTVVRGPITRL